MLIYLNTQYRDDTESAQITYRFSLFAIKIPANIFIKTDTGREMVIHTFNLGRQKQVDLHESNASLIYSISSRTARATQRSPVCMYVLGGKNHPLKRSKRTPLIAEFLWVQGQQGWQRETLAQKQKMKTTDKAIQNWQNRSYGLNTECSSQAHVF